MRDGSLETLEVGLGFIELGEEALFGLELARVDAAAPSLHADRMFEVQHLVVQKVFDRAARCIGAVEDSADDDGVMGGVVVAQHSACMVGAPCEGGAAQETVEEACVERLEDLVEVVVMAYRSKDALAPAGLADMLGLPGDSL